ncbi:hypothetical protein, partial [Candidatus Entotheonella palauensis]|uniref:hypothetical protein n=1 Tax=Candidatus Entotheonella palauensis TaxID=93172 RepID=UPI001C4E1769
FFRASREQVADPMIEAEILGGRDFLCIDWGYILLVRSHDAFAQGMNAVLAPPHHFLRIGTFAAINSSTICRMVYSPV